MTPIIYFSGGGVTGVWQRVNELLIRRNAARLVSFAYQRLLFFYCALCSACVFTSRSWWILVHSLRGAKAAKLILRT